jgi:hypothetical protein
VTGDQVAAARRSRVNAERGATEHQPTRSPPSVATTPGTGQPCSSLASICRRWASSNAWNWPAGMRSNWHQQCAAAPREPNTSSSSSTA